MTTETKWLRFQEQPKMPGRKTSIWTVSAKESGVCLGEIAWYGPWRQYVFNPANGCLFNRTCLRDLATFCEEAMNARQVARV